MAQISLMSYENEVRGLIEARAFDEAMAVGRHILQYYPKHIETYRLLAEACLGSGKHKEAIDLFLRVLSVDPEDVASRVGLSEAYEAEGDINSAVLQMKEAFDLAPSSAQIRSKLHRLIEKQTGQAAPKLKLTRRGLGRIYMRGGLYTQAADEFETLLREDPDQLDVEVSLAEALWRDGQRIRAIEVCQNILNKLPHCLKANLILAETWLRSDREDEAEEHLQIVRDLDPEGRLSREIMGDDSPVPRAPVHLPVLEDISAAPQQPFAPALPEGSSAIEHPPAQESSGPPRTAGSAQDREPAGVQEETIDIETAALPDWLQDMLPDGVEPGQGDGIPSWLTEGTTLEADGLTGEAAVEETDGVAAGAIAPSERSEEIEEVEGGIPEWLLAAELEPFPETDVDEIGTVGPPEPAIADVSPGLEQIPSSDEDEGEAEEEPEQVSALEHPPDEPLEGEPVGPRQVTAEDLPPEDRVSEEEQPAWLHLLQEAGTEAQLPPSPEPPPEAATDVAATQAPATGTPLAQGDVPIAEDTAPATGAEPEAADGLEPEAAAETGEGAEEDIPDWLRALRAEELAGQPFFEEDIPAQPPHAETMEPDIVEAGPATAHAIVEGDEPDWLRAVREGTAGNAPPTSEGNDQPDGANGAWETAGSQTGGADQGEEEPAWLRILREEEFRLPTEQDLETAGLVRDEEPAAQGKQAETTAEQGPELPDWLLSAARDEGLLELAEEIPMAQVAAPQPVEAYTTDTARPRTPEDSGGTVKSESGAEDLPAWVVALYREGIDDAILDEQPEGEAADLSAAEDGATPWLHLVSDGAQAAAGGAPDVATAVENPQDRIPPRKAASEAAAQDVKGVAEPCAGKPTAEKEGGQEPLREGEEKVDWWTQLQQESRAAEAEGGATVSRPPATPGRGQPDPSPIFPGEQVDEATISSYENVLATDAKDHLTRWKAVQAYANKGEHEDAIRHAEQLVQSGEYLSEVIAYLETLTGRGCESQSAYRVLGDAYFKKDRLEDALRIYRTALSLFQ